MDEIKQNEINDVVDKIVDSILDVGEEAKEVNVDEENIDDVVEEMVKSGNSELLLSSVDKEEYADAIEEPSKEEVEEMVNIVNSIVDNEETTVDEENDLEEEIVDQVEDGDVYDFSDDEETTVDEEDTMLKTATEEEPTGDLDIVENAEEVPTDTEEESVVENDEVVVTEEQPESIMLTEECTGEEPEKKKFKSINEALSDLGSAEMKEDEEEIFTPEDVRNGINSSPIFMTEAAESNTEEGEQKPEFEISDESVIQLLNVINKIKAKENFNIYSELPQEVKVMVDKYLASNGLGGHSVQSNTARNSICKSLMEEFISTVSMEKTVNDFNKEMETLFNNVGKEFSTIYKDYDKERDNYLKSLLERVPEDDPKRQKLINVMDAIYDAYKLERVKEFAKTMKPFKSIEIEKPGQRVFSSFEQKYKNSDHNIYPLQMIVDVLNKYNDIEDKKGNLLFVLTFAKSCAKYSPEVVEEHAFMYYTIYNIILLDIYKGEDFDNYAPELLATVNEIIKIVEERQATKNSNNIKK